MLSMQDALQLDGDTAAGDSGEVDGSELEDLDDYINKLDAGARRGNIQHSILCDQAFCLFLNHVIKLSANRICQQ